ncbi:MAG: ABC-2 family transporter protein [Lachnospiraceae bacterium]|nr:ABC-2 family transporter protein [Lachnospiraceae bacterium]
MISLYPYFAFAKKSFLGRSAYRFDHFMGILNTILRIFIFWEIYRALYGGRAEVDGVTITMVATNFILSLGLDSVFCVNDYYLPNRIQDGSIATEMLLPVNFHGRMLADNLGNALFQLLFHFVPAVAISVIFIGIAAPADPLMLILFFLSALFGYGVLWTISFVAQMLSFWLINVWSIMTIKNVFINVLSGSMIPLWFMPDWMSGIIRFTPFSSIYFTPVQIYLGQLSLSEILQGFLIQLFWIVFLFSAGMFLWKKGQKKLVVQGG